MINDQATTANAIRRTKIHEVAVPNQGVFDPLELITTDQGNGKVRTVKIDMESDYMTIETIHETT